MGGLTSLLLLLCVGVTVSTVLDLQKRVEGGKDCQRQYHVKILDEDGDLLCGGSLLKNDWILTAAHCWEWVMKAVVGGPNKTPVRITALPVMYGDDKNRIHDIMLLQLPNPSGIPHVELPDCVPEDPPAIGATVQVAGYGAKTPGSDKTSATLRCADMTVDKCTVDHDNPEQMHYMFCGKTSNVKICDGDSGGGVVYNNKFHGVISSSQGRHKCAPEAGFMNVCRYKAWIEGIIKNKKASIDHIAVEKS